MCPMHRSREGAAQTSLDQRSCERKLQASVQSPSLPSLLIILKRWRVIAAVNSKVSIYLLEINFYLTKTFLIIHRRVREVDVVIVEKEFE